MPEASHHGVQNRVNSSNERGCIGEVTVRKAWTSCLVEVIRSAHRTIFGQRDTCTFIVTILASSVSCATALLRVTLDTIKRYIFKAGKTKAFFLRMEHAAASVGTEFGSIKFNSIALRKIGCTRIVKGGKHRRSRFGCRYCRWLACRCRHRSVSAGKSDKSRSCVDDWRC